MQPTPAVGGGASEQESTSHICIKKPCAYCAALAGRPIPPASLILTESNILPFLPRDARKLALRVASAPPDVRALVRQLLDHLGY